MTELRVWTGRQTAGHATMPQSTATGRAEAHAHTLHSTICTHNTQLCSGCLFCKVHSPKEIIAALYKHMVVNEHAGLRMHNKTSGLFRHYTK